MNLLITILSIALASAPTAENESSSVGGSVSAKCTAVSAGVGEAGQNALFNYGQALIGRSSRSSVIMHAGAMGCIGAVLAPTLPGDCNTDQIVELSDYSCMHDCMSGPGGGLKSGCGRFDFDDDDDVDDYDWLVIQPILDVGS